MKTPKLSEPEFIELQNAWNFEIPSVIKVCSNLKIDNKRQQNMKTPLLVQVGPRVVAEAGTTADMRFVVLKKRQQSSDSELVNASEKTLFW